MRAYELMVIIDGDVDDEAARAWSGRVQSMIEGAGGEVKRSDFWGRRRFAYQINKKWEGTYFVLELLGPGGSALDDVERSLRLADDVVRHKLIRLPDSEATRRGLVGEAAAAS
jgi:small subunit ribosomal protein S6